MTKIIRNKSFSFGSVRVSYLSQISGFGSRVRVSYLGQVLGFST